VKSHAAVAAVLLGSEALVQQVLDDIDSSPLTDAEKLLMHFLDRVNHDSPRITPADIGPLHAAGWTDEQIWYGITVCALFNFYNRWIDASGVCALSDEAHREGGKRSAAVGYARR
jgi:alkylhydroperoxidase family enzyme